MLYKKEKRREREKIQNYAVLIVRFIFLSFLFCIKRERILSQRSQRKLLTLHTYAVKAQLAIQKREYINNFFVPSFSFIFQWIIVSTWLPNAEKKKTMHMSHHSKWQESEKKNE